jgi:hypothetical protein
LSFHTTLSTNDFQIPLPLREDSPHVQVVCVRRVRVHGFQRGGEERAPRDGTPALCHVRLRGHGTEPAEQGKGEIHFIVILSIRNVHNEKWELFQPPLYIWFSTLQSSYRQK